MINFFWGVMFILLGMLFFLANFNLIEVQWGIIFSLWPFLIILLGIYFLPGKWQVISTLALTMVLSGVMIYAVEWDRLLGTVEMPNLTAEAPTKPQENFDYEAFTSKLTTTLDQNFDFAKFSLKATHGRYRIKPTKDQLFNLKASNPSFESFNLNQSSNEDTGSVEVKLSQVANRAGQRKPMVLGFDQKPVWDIRLDMDSTVTNLNLKPFKLEHLHLKATEADIQLKLGKRYKQQRITIDGNGSKLYIQLPQKVGAEMITEEPLPVNIKMRGFQKKGDKTYETANYPIADKQIRLRLESKPEKLVIKRQ